MKKTYLQILPVVAAIMAFTACTNDVREPYADEDNNLPTFTATIGTLSRAYDNSWERGDEIGISGSGGLNVRYATDNGDGNFTVKTPGDQIYFHSDNDTKFTAYYPWTDDLKNDATQIDVVTSDQSKQKTFDFLWAEAYGKKSKPNVNFAFDHKMVKLFLTVFPGEGMTYAELKDAALSLGGFSHTGTFNIGDGTTTVGNPGNLWSFNQFAHSNDEAGTLTFSLIFLPQTFDKPLEFEAALNGDSPLKAPVDFTAANRGKDGETAKNEWIAGCQYNLSLTLGRAALIVNGATINNWSELEGGNIIVK